MNSIRSIFKNNKKKCFFGFSVGGLSWFYKKKAAYDLIYEHTDNNKKIIKFCKSLFLFSPTIYLLSGQLQAYFGANDTNHDTNVVYEKQEIQIPGKGNFVLEWANFKDNTQTPQNIQNGEKLIIIVPGVTASSNEPYIINMISECLKNGYKVVMYNDRLYSLNSSKFHLNDKNYYCYLEDLSSVFDYIFKENNYKEYYAIGHSLGANTLVRKLKAVVSVGNPWDLNIVQKNLQGAYDKYILESRQFFLKKKKEDILKYFEKINRKDIDLEHCINAQSSQEYDDCFTKKIHGGYEKVEDYFNFMTSANYIDKINVPLLCLQAKDDPICNEGSIPVEKCKKNNKILLWMSETGGHVGWYQGFLKPERWYMKPVLEFIEFHSKQQHQLNDN